MKTLIAPFLPPLETRNWQFTALKNIQLDTAKSRWQELSAGLTTFVTMAYAVIVNPLILAHAGMPIHSVFFATCITTAFACFAMGLWARLPIAIAPSMAINGYFVAHLVPFYHGQWHQALTCVLLSGILLVIIACLKWPRHIIRALPNSIILATMSGIGLLIVTVALQASGIFPKTFSLPYTLNMHALINFGLTCSLLVLGKRYNIPGYALISMLIVTLLANGLWPAQKIPLAHIIINGDTFNQIDLRWTFRTLVHAGILASLIVFDSTSTLHTLTEKSPLSATSSFPQQQRLTLMTTGISTMIGAHLGTSNMGIYFESAAGLSAGGRTGWCAIIVGMCFLACLLLAPYLSLVPNAVPTATLCMIALSIAKKAFLLDRHHARTFIPACITLIGIPAMRAIADGMGLGLLVYIMLNYKTGEIKRPTWILTLIFLIYFGVRLTNLIQ